ncbi:6-phosphogluconate dehydrogenase, decarboxylating [Bacillus subtilis]|nr:6-phosphogluconate dehydrogenase, decarboxylating [Bacillus subtilis]RPK25177.1 6-phosphogluconate dehydrogenase, decarboxylating [Bacillus subtilis]
MNQAAVDELKAYGAEGTTNLTELISSLVSPRILWVMVPHGVVDAVLRDVTPLLSKGDIIIEAARHEACFMVGGDPEAWEIAEPLLPWKTDIFTL